MGVWHLQFSLVPELGVIRAHGHVPSELGRFKALTSEEALKADDSEEESENYWRDVNPFSDTEIVEAVSTILPPMKSWSREALMFGSEDGHQLQLWNDDFLCRIDLRQFDPKLVESVLRLARRLNCLIALHEDGKVIEADDAQIAEACLSSQAYRFVRNPEGTLKAIRELGKGRPKD